MSWLVRGFIALAMMLLLQLAPGGGAPNVQAQTPSPDLSIEVKGSDCDTKGVNPTECEIGPGFQFTVSVSINNLAGLPDQDSDTKAGYPSLQVRVNYSGGLTLKKRSGVDEVIWPDCEFAAEFKDESGSYLAGCTTGANESTFTGPVVEVDFSCLPAGIQETITLIHGVSTGSNPLGDTHLVTEGLQEVAEVGNETLTINCPTSVGGIAQLPDVARTPLGNPDSLAGNLDLLGGIAGTAAIIVAGGTVWYLRRRSNKSERR